MDPNATLKRIRELAAKVLSDEYPHDHDARELAALMDSLDGWLSRGQIRPNAWAFSR